MFILKRLKRYLISKESIKRFSVRRKNQKMPRLESLEEMVKRGEGGTVLLEAELSPGEALTLLALAEKREISYSALLGELVSWALSSLRVWGEPRGS